jgi:nucleoside-diphosphate-sugar epimerase
MKIFITGASGCVGSVVTEKALQRGHDVVGLVRSERSAEKIHKLGAKPLVASLDDVASLESAAREAEAVLHLGFVHDFTRPYNEVLDIDARAIQALGRALTGTNRALITTSGTPVVASDSGRETPENFSFREGHIGDRGRAEKTTLDLSNHGVRAMVIRLAPYVYGRGGSYFVPINMQAAAKHGFAFYVGSGTQMTTAADVDAAAELYLLAMEKGKAGSVFNCSTETDVQVRKLAEAIAKALDIKAKDVTIEQASEMCGAFPAFFLQIENRASSAKARLELGWAPKPKYSVCDDIVHGSYKSLADQLKAGMKVAH